MLPKQYDEGEPGTNQMLGDEVTGTWLLFDAHCSTCSRISQNLEATTEGKLAVLPLDSDFALRARRQVFGEDMPHKPTFLKVVQGEPRAWTGARIAPLVAREVGFEGSLQILKILGIERSGRNHDRQAGLLSRRGFAQVAGGIAASFGILAAGSFAGARPASASAIKPSKIATRSRVGELVKTAIDSADFVNIADDTTLEKMRAGSLSARSQLAEFQYQLGSESIEIQSYSDSDPLVQASSGEDQDGEPIETLAITLESVGVVYSVNFSNGGTDVRAERYSVDFNEGEVELVDASSNGVRMEPLPEGVAAQRSDPCGGCTSATKLTVGPTCQTNKVLDCAFSASGCASCAVACGSGVGTAGCATCLFGSCGAMIKTCCKKVGGQVCLPCGGGTP
jgi:hypothetical protein